MNGFTDIHTHIMPGVDDGAANLQDACRMVQTAWQDGTRTLFLTPHWRGISENKTPARLQENFAAFCQTVAESFPDMQLFLGNEVHYGAEISEKLLAGETLPLNGSRYVLLEFWVGALRSQILTGISEIIGCGFTPIIAHAERYRIFQTDATLVDEVLEMGALIQMNANSVMGGYGFKMKRLCHRLLKAQKVHFIASDAHNTETRTPRLRACFLRICKKYGQSYAVRVFYENAQAVIENRPL